MARLNSNSVGTVLDASDGALPFACIWPDGKTIGNASSGGTNRANDDTKMLFFKLWTSFTNTELPVSGGRGGSALADWNANKTITIPDLRGRTSVGKDDMGGTTASRITLAGSGITGTTLGATGGAQTHTLSTAELAVHTHTQNAHGHNITDTGGTMANGDLGTKVWRGLTTTQEGGAYPINATTATNQNAGSGNAHNNTQPSYVLNKVMVYR